MFARGLRRVMSNSEACLAQSMKRVRGRPLKDTSTVAPEKFFATKNEPPWQAETTAARAKNKLSFENLHHDRPDAPKEPKASKTKKLRATVDLSMMREELKQLEDPPVTEEEKKLSSDRLPYAFFDVPCEDLAKKLLGKILVRRLENGTILKGRIVETEAYLGEADRASQTYGGKVTPRNIPMYMPPGTIYVYLTYGMYHCFNISSGGKGCAVLLRALEPMAGIEEMRGHRTARLMSRQEARKGSRTLANHEICSGPSKLCIALQIERSKCKYSICNCKSMWIENDVNFEDLKIVRSARIGIDSAGPEWASKPLRYYVYGNTSVSKRDKRAEGEFIGDV